MYSGVQRKIKWDSGSKDMLYTYSENYSPTNCQRVTTKEKKLIDQGYRSPAISHKSAHRKTVTGKRRGPKIPIRFLHLSEDAAAEAVQKKRPSGPRRMALKEFCPHPSSRA